VREARAYFTEGLKIGDEVDNDRMRGFALNALGEMARLEGDYPAAKALFEKSLTCYRPIGDRANESTVLLNLAAVISEMGDLRAARACFGEALALDRDLGHKRGIACSLDGLAGVAGRRHEWERAARLAGAAAALREEMGYESERADRAFRDRYCAEVRAALGERAFESAMAEGRAMTLEEAVRLAVEELGA
jgi:tetratricopeptide (TPR) repeat protein